MKLKTFTHSPPSYTSYTLDGGVPCDKLSSTIDKIQTDSEINQKKGTTYRLSPF